MFGEVRCLIGCFGGFFAVMLFSSKTSVIVIPIGKDKTNSYIFARIFYFKFSLYQRLLHVIFFLPITKMQIIFSVCPMCVV